MSKMCRFISDNTPTSEPNILTMVQHDDGDIEFRVSIYHPQQRSISISTSGSRLKNHAKVINLFSQIIDAINEEEEIRQVKPRCNRCVYELNCSKDKDNERNCLNYKRDASDGGYYG